MNDVYFDLNPEGRLCGYMFIHIMTLEWLCARHLPVTGVLLTINHTSDQATEPLLSTVLRR